MRPRSLWSLTRFHALVGRSQRRAGRAMTYCLGMLLDAGMVLIADTRTNAGVDNFSCYKKLHCLADSPDRQVFAASSGSLSVSQSVIALLEDGLPQEDKEDTDRTSTRLQYSH